MKKLFFVLVCLIFLSQQCVYSLALRPLATQDSIEQYNAVSDALLQERDKLCRMVKEDQESLQMVKLLLYLEMKLHMKEIVTSTGVRYNLFTEVTDDGVLHISLQDYKGSLSQAVAGMDLTSSIDIDLEHVGFENGPICTDLTNQGIGSAIVEKVKLYIPSYCKLTLMIVNKPTLRAFKLEYPKTVSELIEVFKSKVIGKWLAYLGFNEFIFKVLPAQWETFSSSEVKEVVTDNNLSAFLAQTDKNKGFFILTRKINYADICESAGAVYIGMQEGIEDIEDMVVFNAPSRTTIMIPKSEFNYTSIKNSIKESNKKFVTYEDPGNSPTGEIVLEDQDYGKIIYGMKPSFAVLDVLKAG